jgi:hypothetical protein
MTNVTSAIVVQDLNKLIQINGQQYTQDLVDTFGSHGERGTIRETTADQKVDYALFRQAEWEDRKETFLEPAWFDTEDFIKRTVKFIDKETGCKSIHNTAAIEQAQEMRVEFSRRFRERIAKQKSKDMEAAVGAAREAQKDMYAVQDERNQWDAEDRAENQVFIDNRTPEGAYYMHNKEAMDYMSMAEILMFIEHEDNFGLMSKAGYMHTEEMTADYRRVEMRIKRFQKEVFSNNRYNRQEGEYYKRCWSIAFKHNSEYHFFCIPEEIRELFRLRDLKRRLFNELVREGERREEKKLSQAKKREAAFWERQNNPDGILEIQKGEEYIFYGEDGELMPGSCTEVKYVMNDGTVG